MEADRIRTLKARIADFEDAIEKFQRKREEIKARRRGAADHIVVELDERLVTNKRTLDALSRSLDLTRVELKREERTES